MIFGSVFSVDIKTYVYLKEKQPNSCKPAEEGNMLVIGVAQLWGGESTIGPQ